MDKLNIERIAQLAGYRKLNETADYDFGGVEPRTHKVAAIASRPGQANLPVRNVNLQGDNPLLVDEEGEDCVDDVVGMEGNCEADPQFDGMGDDYISSMLDMMQRAPVMASSEANMQWMAAANAELARRQTFAQLAAQAEQEAAVQAASAIIEPEAAQVTAPVVDVMLDRNGYPERMTIVQDGRFFVRAQNQETGELEVIPRDVWDSCVLDNDSMYDNVRVGDRLPQVAPETPEDDMVVLGIGEDEEMEEGIDWPEEKRHSDKEWDEDELDEGAELDMPGHKDRDDEDDEDDEDEDLDEGVMDVIRQHVNPEILSKAHNVLTKAGITDMAIMNRDVNMTPSGYTKLAHILTGEPMADMDAEDYCKHVLHALADSLDEGHPIDESEQLDEFVGMGGDQRFTYTTDSMGNVSISDSMTGASTFLQGQDAQEVLGQLEMYGSTPEAVQEILGQYEHTMDGQVDADGNEVGLDIPATDEDDAVDAFGF
jgi:hypothetical protein